LVPHLLRTAAGDVVELPVEWATDARVQFVKEPDVNWSMQIQGPDAGMAVFEVELEAAHTYGGLWIAVWHPMASDRLS
jgi:peptidoglycan-N-acetylglucosamine deacetylase